MIPLRSSPRAEMTQSAPIQIQIGNFMFLSDNTRIRIHRIQISNITTLTCKCPRCNVQITNFPCRIFFECRAFAVCSASAVGSAFVACRASVACSVFAAYSSFVACRASVVCSVLIAFSSSVIQQVPLSFAAL